MLLIARNRKKIIALSICLAVALFIAYYLTHVEIMYMTNFRMQRLESHAYIEMRVAAQTESLIQFQLLNNAENTYAYTDRMWLFVQDMFGQWRRVWPQEQIAVRAMNWVLPPHSYVTMYVHRDSVVFGHLSSGEYRLVREVLEYFHDDRNNRGYFKVAGGFTIY